MYNPPLACPLASLSLVELCTCLAEPLREGFFGNAGSPARRRAGRQTPATMPSRRRPLHAACLAPLGACPRRSQPKPAPRCSPATRQGPGGQQLRAAGLRGALRPGRRTGARCAACSRAIMRARGTAHWESIQGVGLGATTKRGSLGSCHCVRPCRARHSGQPLPSQPSVQAG